MHTKKAVVSLNAAPLSIQTRCICTKKAGLHCCCSAFRGSRIAFCSEQATPKPALICTHAHTYLRCVRIWIYISRGHQNAAMRWNSFEFARFRNAKHKARWTPHKTSFIGDPVLTPLLCLQLPHPKDIIPSVG